MSPHDIWYQYYNRKCEVCEETIHLKEENDYHCERCTTIMCEGCFKKVECVVCVEMINRGDNVESPTFCAECMQSCQACGGATFHSLCKHQHLTTCIPTGTLIGKSAVSTPTIVVRSAKRKLPSPPSKQKKAKDTTKAAKKNKGKAL